MRKIKKGEPAPFTAFLLTSEEKKDYDMVKITLKQIQHMRGKI